MSPGSGASPASTGWRRPRSAASSRASASGPPAGTTIRAESRRTKAPGAGRHSRSAGIVAGRAAAGAHIDERDRNDGQG